MPKDFLQNMAGKIQDSLPEGLKNMHEEIDRTVKSQLENVLPNFQFVKQDEFEIQQKILLKTRAEVDDLKARVAELETIIKTLQTPKEE